MKLSEVRLLGDNELKTKLTDSRQEYLNLRFQMVTGQLTDTSRLKQSRRLIAMYETILHERELGIGQEGGKK
jgi:large subunit ribosomal protein L29